MQDLLGFENIRVGNKVKELYFSCLLSNLYILNIEGFFSLVKFYFSAFVQNRNFGLLNWLPSCFCSSHFIFWENGELSVRHTWLDISVSVWKQGTLRLSGEEVHPRSREEEEVVSVRQKLCHWSDEDSDGDGRSWGRTACALDWVVRGEPCDTG